MSCCQGSPHDVESNPLLVEGGAPSCAVPDDGAALVRSSYTALEDDDEIGSSSSSSSSSSSKSGAPRSKNSPAYDFFLLVLGAEPSWATTETKLGGRPADLLDSLRIFRNSPHNDSKDLPDENRIPELADNVLLVLLSVGYLWYRSNSLATFDETPFLLQLNDIWGLVFLLAFAVTRRVTYLIYAINPIRDLVLASAEYVVPALAARDWNEEMARDILPAWLQHGIGLASLHYIRKQPIGRGTELGKLVPFADSDGPAVRNVTFWLLVVALSTPAIFVCVLAYVGDITARNMVWYRIILKLCLSIPLGMSEEICWREVVLLDTNNVIQTLVWGIDHVVSGEGYPLNKYLYGVVACTYGFALGVMHHYRLPRFFNHTMVEFLCIGLLFASDDDAWKSET